MHILDSRAVSRKEVIKWWRWRSDCDSRSTPRSSSVMLVLFIHRLFSSLYLFSTCNLSAFPYHRNDHPRSMDNKQSRRSRLFPFLQWYVSYCSLIQVLTPSLFPTLISYHISNPTLSHPKKKNTNKQTDALPQLPVNTILTLAGILHGIHAITARLTPSPAASSQNQSQGPGSTGGLESFEAEGWGGKVFLTPTGESGLGFLFCHERGGGGEGWE